MKKTRLLFLFLPLCLPLFAQDVGYPGVINNGTVFLNAGIGFGNALDDAELKIPLLLTSADFAIPIASLPVTVGVMAGYASQELVTTSEEVTTTAYSHILGAAFRFAYHKDWGIKPLDTYAHLLIGDLMAWTSVSSNIQQGGTSSDFGNNFWFGAGIGGRWFFHRNIGAYAELNLAKFYIFGFGVSFKV